MISENVDEGADRYGQIEMLSEGERSRTGPAAGQPRFGSRSAIRRWGRFAVPLLALPVQTESGERTEFALTRASFTLFLFAQIQIRSNSL